jgi:hypothetical protein
VTWPTDKKFRRFAALVADAVQAEGIDKCCPLGAVCSLVGDACWRAEGNPEWPRSDTSSFSVSCHLGGDQSDWQDQCRAFEVGFDGDDPRAEGVRRDDTFYRLGVTYRELGDRHD